MDVDAILKRRPTLVLVDELAHANIPGSRREKRYQDAEDLLAAGIDVYTTLNIQHIESLKDVVARISRIQVRETLPDNVLEAASEIELIDLPPDDLIQRLRQGKVYMPDQDGRLQIAAGYPPEDQLALKDWGAGEWAWEHGGPAGWKTETLPAADWLFLPMRTRRGMVDLLKMLARNAGRIVTHRQILREV